MLKGLIDAYRYLGDKEYLNLALKNARFIQENLIKEDGSMFHNHKNGKSTINGYLEDYAAVSDAFLGLYEVTLDEKWLTSSKNLLDHCLKDFFDPESGLFFFTSKNDDFMIRRTIETSDNVIPASNSIMAKNLFKISKLFPNTNYEQVSQQMLKTIQGNFDKNAQSHANWLHIVLYMNQPFYEIAIVGDTYLEKVRELQRHYLPNSIFAGTGQESELSLLQNRFVEGKTLIYVCQHGSCKLPITDTKEVLKQVQVSEKD